MYRKNLFLAFERSRHDTDVKLYSGKQMGLDDDIP